MENDPKLPKLDRFLRIREMCELLGGVHQCTFYRDPELRALLREVTKGVVGAFESEFIRYQQSRPLAQKPERTKRLMEGRAKVKGRKAGGAA